MARETQDDEKFNSFEEVQRWSDDYQRQNYGQFYVRDSRTIAATQKWLPKRQLKAELKYYQVTYACVHGGRKYKSASSGSRPHQQWVQFR